MPFRTLCVLFATQSVANCIPTLWSVRNDNRNAPRRSAQTTHYRATLRVVMPFRTLCVLLGGAPLRVQGHDCTVF
ncbi:hypothetical protein CBI55_22875 [Pseudomonas syringae]|nr:hypothetical protein CBI55_22875 [Pseudomonas syringae]POP76927.1 hypothetical protein CXB38_24145 [Pseudomonas syringae]